MSSWKGSNKTNIVRSNKVCTFTILRQGILLIHIYMRNGCTILFVTQVNEKRIHIQFNEKKKWWVTWTAVGCDMYTKNCILCREYLDCEVATGVFRQLYGEIECSPINLNLPMRYNGPELKTLLKELKIIALQHSWSIYHEVPNLSKSSNSLTLPSTVRTCIHY